MTAVESPAATLRRAAEKIRKLAEALGDNRGPWYVSANRGYPQEISNIGVPYIAAMHPGVGLALAAWLDDMAGTVDAYVRKIEKPADGGEPWLRAAVTVALAVLGGES